MTIQHQIILIDQTLSMLREFWMDAPIPQKVRYMDKIHTALDRRLELMEARDTQGE